MYALKNVDVLFIKKTFWITIKSSNYETHLYSQVKEKKVVYALNKREYINAMSYVHLDLINKIKKSCKNNGEDYSLIKFAYICPRYI